MTDEATVEAAVKRIEHECGRLDVLVNNAGAAVEWGIEPERVGADELRRAYEVNVFGVATVTRAALNALTVLYANVLRPKGILVNAANPGLVGTDLNNLAPGRDGVRGATVPVRLAC